MRLATWNVNSLTARMPRVTRWIEENEPDVLCLQETKQADDKFPSSDFAALGYESAHYGDGRWNGVALLSRVGLADEAHGFGTPHDDHGCRLVAATCGGVRVHSVYVPNGRSLDNEFYGIKLEWLAQLRTLLDETHGGKVELTDGLRVERTGGWVLVLPNASDATLNVYAEGSTDDEALRYVDETVGRIEDLVRA